MYYCMYMNLDFPSLSVEIINVEDNRASGGSDNGKTKDYIHPSNMEVF